MVVGNGVGNRLQKHCLTGLGLCHDKRTLTLADRRKEVDDAVRHCVVTIARKAKGTGEWFIGNSSDENGHASTLKLDFLDPGKKYVATIYADGKKAHYEHNPADYTITTKTVTAKSVLKLKAAPGGGYAVRIVEK